jgi:hypothetical protein
MPGPQVAVAITDYHPHVGPGLVIGARYTLIGEGGMGEVWVARQTEPGSVLQRRGICGSARAPDR